jgi:glyoxylase-like metal-dependent hydrolase (beta-lactamase superfamily II)
MMRAQAPHDLDRPHVEDLSSSSASRRALLQASVGGVAAGLTLAGCGGGGASALSVTELDERLAVIAGAGVNVVALRGPDGLLLVDGGLAEHADAVSRTASRALGARNIPVLFNTHWHREQTGLNDRLGRRGTKIIAHENTRLWLGATVNRRWEDRVYEPLPEHARPNDTIYDKGSMTWSDEPIDYGYLLQAHTDGDIYVFFRNANVLVTGGVVSGEGWPIVDWTTGGWIGGMVNGVQTLVDLADENTRVVPSVGPVLTRADLERQLAMYTDLRDKLRLAWQASHGIDEVLAQGLAAEYEPEFGNADLFLALAYKSWWGHVRELSVV